MVLIKTTIAAFIIFIDVMGFLNFLVFVICFEFFEFFYLFQNPPIDSSSPDGLKPASMEGFIEFKNVSFRYPSRPDTQVCLG